MTSLGFRSYCPVFSVCMFMTSLLRFVDPFDNDLCFEFVMKPLSFSSYNYVSLSFLLSHPSKTLELKTEIILES